MAMLAIITLLLAMIAIKSNTNNRLSTSLEVRSSGKSMVLLPKETD